MRKLLLLLTGVVLFATHAMAQRTVTGKVTDENGKPVPNASVLVKGTTTGTVTKADGSYSLTVPANAKALIFSSVDMTTMEISIGVNKTVNATLRAEETALTEVVVTALGFTTLKDKNPNASSTVKGAALKASGETSILSALSSKASGVQVTRTTGDPGSSVYVQIRGQSTISSSVQPLIVLDGIPMFNSEFGGGTAGVVQQSRLNDINPGDIANIEILKGAAAAALYGTNAANGVIMITTKRGKLGDKVNISFTSTVSIDKINQSVPLQKVYGQGSNGLFTFNSVNTWGDKIANRPGGNDVPTGTAYFLLPDGSKRFALANGTIAQPNGGKNSRDVYDHATDLFQNGVYYDNNIAVSGGDDKSTFYVSISNLKQDGIVKGNSSYDRTSIKVNADRRFGKAFKLVSGFTYSHVISDRVQQGSNLNGIFLGGLRTPPDFNNNIYEGTYVDAAGNQFINRQVAYRNSIGAATSSGYDNPFWVVNRILNKNRVDRFMVNVEATLNVNDWISIINRTGIDYYSDVRDDYFPFISSGANNTGLYNLETITQRLFNNNLIARFTKEVIKDIDLNVYVGYNYNSQYTSSLAGQIKNFLIPDAPANMGNASGADRTSSNFFSWSRKNAGYASMDLTLYDQLFLQFTGRAERASTFADMFFFPSASIGWQFTKLAMFNQQNILSFGKLRGSYGKVGVEPAPYLTNTFFIPGSIGEGWGPTINANAPSYGGGYLRSTLWGNPFIEPEIKKEFEIGTDLRFNKNLYSFSFTYYRNKTIGAIFNVDVAPSAGFSSKWGNAASLENKGMEIDFGATWLKKKNFSATTNLVWSRNRNKVLDMAGTNQIILEGFVSVSSSSVVGQPLGALWGQDFARDSKGAILTNANGFPQGMTPSSLVIGDPNPDWNAGLNTTLRYKNFNFSFLFDHVQGGDVWNGTKGALYVFGTHGDLGNEATAFVDLKTSTGATILAGSTFRGYVHDFGAGPVALTQSWYTGLGGGFSGPGTQFIEDGTRTRLREINLGYSLNNPKIFGAQLNAIDLSFSGRNLALWTDYQGVDPETNLTGASNGRGLDYFNNPSTKSFLISLKITY